MTPCMVTSSSLEQKHNCLCRLDKYGLVTIYGAAVDAMPENYAAEGT